MANARHSKETPGKERREALYSPMPCVVTVRRAIASRGAVSTSDSISDPETTLRETDRDNRRN